jgi:ATP-dependent phosphofructokinase / diphosphate-dependent phosphofructokinase
MKIGILTGGGDTASLNAILYGAFIQAKKNEDSLVGFKKGWQGFLNPVQRVDLNELEISPSIGGTILKTSRTNPSSETIEEIVENVQINTDGLIVVGGDDTLNVGKKILPKLKVPICFVPKTIDNDVGINSPEGNLDFEKIINYFNSGFITAAHKINNYADELKTTAYSHERIVFLESMGRSPGWLALSSFRAKPDFILIPEVPLNFESFGQSLIKVYERKKSSIVVVAEGVKYENGSFISCNEISCDEFQNKKMGGAAEELSLRVRKEFGLKKCNSVNPGYLYRCGVLNSLGDKSGPFGGDLGYGIRLGIEATKTIQAQLSGNVITTQKEKNKIILAVRKVEDSFLTNLEGKIIPRNVDLRFYDSEGYSITQEGRNYFGPLLEK